MVLTTCSTSMFWSLSLNIHVILHIGVSVLATHLLTEMLMRLSEYVVVGLSRRAMNRFKHLMSSKVV